MLRLHSGNPQIIIKIRSIKILGEKAMKQLTNLFKNRKQDQNNKKISKKSIAIALTSGSIITAIVIALSGGAISVQYKEDNKKEEVQKELIIEINPHKPTNNEKLD